MTGPTRRALWATFDLPSGVTAEAIQQPITWDGERLPLRRAPMWMEHTYDVVVDELGVDAGALRRARRRRACCGDVLGQAGSTMSSAYIPAVMCGGPPGTSGGPSDVSAASRYAWGSAPIGMPHSTT